MRWLTLTIVGVLLNCLGLCFLGEAITHHTVEAGALTAGLGDGLLALVLINLGIIVMIEAGRRRP
jgi:cadmium resistance protein CadD (predicted permease)